MFKPTRKFKVWSGAKCRFEGFTALVFVPSEKYKAHVKQCQDEGLF